jgi:hypothetical protein
MDSGVRCQEAGLARSGAALQGSGERSRQLVGSGLLDLGEAEALALAKSSATDWFLTDDWETA